MKLEIRYLSKSYGSQAVLREISLSLERVHTLALIGPSGGGKSTLLRVIAGLERPDRGEVWLNDKEIVFQEKMLREHRRSVGTVFQSFNLFPHLTAFANVTLPLEKVHRYSPSDARQIAEDILKRFQLIEHAHKQPALLSGGQRQRVAIARAIAIKPKLLLFDEPTSALDPEMTGEVLDLIEELREEGRDFLLVTHQMGFARRVADQVAVLSHGRILECGPPSQVFDNSQTEVTRQFLSRILKY
ncbi:MAG: amino acid ABC transporter ATP-binding protein [Verrucomicrobia bacterium]|nr:amino acid ABC transporter ATP-binding protein [Verrucomicrobiota bacterium]MBV9273353.1 amino acid ABC transporter ATP-binding protein [Verrucomicrobiota bacterium]